MSEVAVVVKIKNIVGEGGHRQHSTGLDEHNHPRCTKLELTMLGGPSLNYCSNHPALVWFDGEVCPCCGLMGENKELLWP